MRGRWFAGWVVVGALCASSVIFVFSIGIFLLPVFGLALAYVSRRTRYPLDVLGFVAGLGVPFLVVAFLNRDSHPCPGGFSFGSCGGFDPHPWLMIGLVLSLAGLGVYTALRLASRSRPCRRSTS
jgi:hypothetical protein